MSLSGINMKWARSRVANRGVNEKGVPVSDNICSGSGLVNRISFPGKALRSTRFMGRVAGGGKLETGTAGEVCALGSGKPALLSALEGRHSRAPEQGRREEEIFLTGFPAVGRASVIARVKQALRLGIAYGK